jgi:hypothetical protein
VKKENWASDLGLLFAVTSVALMMLDVAFNIQVWAMRRTALFRALVRHFGAR